MSRTEIFKPKPTDELEQPNGGAPADLVGVARIDKNEALPDTVTFAGLQRMKVKKWSESQGNTFSVTWVSRRIPLAQRRADYVMVFVAASLGLAWFATFGSLPACVSLQ